MKVRLTDICTPRQWKTIPTSELLNEGYPVYGANGIIGYYNGYNHESPVVTITCRGATCGTINITAPKSYVTGNAMCLDDLRPDVLLEYLYYSLLHYNFRNVISGSAQPQITRQGLEKVNIELHSLDEQRTIIDVLSKLERIILARKEELQKLDNLVKARFVEMFGNPVANEKGWHVELLKDVCNGIGDGLHGTPEYDEVGIYPFINGNNLTNGTIEITPSTRMVNIETYANHYIEISDNAILLSINGTLGKLALYNGEKVMLGKSACYCNLRPEINREFVYGVMRTNAFAEFLESNATASTIKNVGLKAIRNFRLIVPPDDLQTKFVAFSRRIDKSKVSVQKSLDEAQLLFDSLMQQYFG